jgi:hydroxyacylglutathione hydrolase
MQIKQFIFNPFQVNTYLIYDDSHECVIIDAACYEKYEVDTLLDFIEKEGLKPKALLNTHGHVDHVCGNLRMMDHFDLPLLMHRDDNYLIPAAVQYGNIFGFNIEQPPAPTGFLGQGDIFNFGDSSLEIIHAPGHSPGSILFYSGRDNLLIAGDVLFSGSIGRTDLPKGNFNTLISSIKTKIMLLPDETRVYPGHGNSTTIGRERETNPFLH